MAGNQRNAMLLDSLPAQRRIGRRLLVRLSRGLRTRPLLTMSLIALSGILAVAILLLFLVAAVSATAVVAVMLVLYGVGRQLLWTRPESRLRRARPAPLESPAATLRRYLGAVEEFGRLAELALTQSVEAPARGKQFRRAAAGARRLCATAQNVLETWRGDESLAEGMRELHSAAESLRVYLDDLQRARARRAPAVALRWQRDDLARQRDSLTDHLRRADFRAAAREPASH